MTSLNLQLCLRFSLKKKTWTERRRDRAMKCGVVETQCMLGKTSGCWMRLQDFSWTGNFHARVCFASAESATYWCDSVCLCCLLETGEFERSAGELITEHMNWWLTDVKGSYQTLLNTLKARWRHVTLIRDTVEASFGQRTEGKSWKNVVKTSKKGDESSPLGLKHTYEHFYCSF